MEKPSKQLKLTKPRKRSKPKKPSSPAAPKLAPPPLSGEMCIDLTSRPSDFLNELGDLMMKYKVTRLSYEFAKPAPHSFLPSKDQAAALHRNLWGTH